VKKAIGLIKGAGSWSLLSRNCVASLPLFADHDVISLTRLTRATALYSIMSI
jgi:hypothetical protein